MLTDDDFHDDLNAELMPEAVQRLEAHLGPAYARAVQLGELIHTWRGMMTIGHVRARLRVVAALHGALRETDFEVLLTPTVQGSSYIPDVAVVRRGLPDDAPYIVDPVLTVEIGTPLRSHDAISCDDGRELRHALLVMPDGVMHWARRGDGVCVERLGCDDALVLDALGVVVAVCQLLAD